MVEEYPLMAFKIKVLKETGYLGVHKAMVTCPWCGHVWKGTFRKFYTCKKCGGKWRRMNRWRSDIAVSAAKRIIKKNGAERVDDRACKELVEILEKIGAEISKEASELAIYAGRITVKETDIEKAFERFNRRCYGTGKLRRNAAEETKGRCFTLDTSGGA